MHIRNADHIFSDLNKLGEQHMYKTKKLFSLLLVSVLTSLPVTGNIAHADPAQSVTPQNVKSATLRYTEPSQGYAVWVRTFSPYLGGDNSAFLEYRISYSHQLLKAEQGKIPASDVTGTTSSHIRISTDTSLVQDFNHYMGAGGKIDIAFEPDGYMVRTTTGNQETVVQGHRTEFVGTIATSSASTP